MVEKLFIYLSILIFSFIKLNATSSLRKEIYFSDIKSLLVIIDTLNKFYIKISVIYNFNSVLEFLYSV